MGIEGALAQPTASTQLYASQGQTVKPAANGGEWFVEQLTVASSPGSDAAKEAQALLESLGGSGSQGPFGGTDLPAAAENFGQVEKDSEVVKKARALFGDVVPGSENEKKIIEAALEVLDPNAVAQGRARDVIQAAMLVFQEQGWQLTPQQFAFFIDIIANRHVTPKSAAYAAAGMELAMGTNKVSGLSNIYSASDGLPYAGRYQINATAGSKVIFAPSGSKRLDIPPHTIQRMSAEIFANPGNPSAWSADTQLAINTYKGYGAAAIAASYGYR